MKLSSYAIALSIGLFSSLCQAAVLKLPDDKVDTSQEVGAINDNFETLDKGKLDIRPGNVLPRTSDFYDLGEASYSWKNAYIKNATFNGKPWVDITAAPYYADPTGTRDNTVVIQAAFDSGSNVFIPQGIFNVSEPIVPRVAGMMVIGTGANSIISENVLVSAPTCISVQASDILLRDFRLDGSSAPVAYGGGRAMIRSEPGADRTMVQHVWVTNSPNTGISFDTCNGCVLQDSYIYRSAEHGIYMDRGDGMRVTNNTFLENGTVFNGNSIKNLTNSATFSENYISSANALNAVIDSENTDIGVPFEGNRFINNTVIGSYFLATPLFTIRTSTNAVPTKMSEVIGNYFEMNYPGTPIDLRGGAVKFIGNETNAHNVDAGCISITSTNPLISAQIIANSFHGGGAETATCIYVTTGTENIIEHNAFYDFGGGIGIHLTTNTIRTHANFNSYVDVAQPISDDGGSKNNFVGIGTVVPDRQLEIYKAGSPVLRFNDSSNTYDIRTNGSLSAGMQWDSNGTRVMVLSSTGNFALGGISATPSIFSVAGTNATYGVDATTATGATTATLGAVSPATIVTPFTWVTGRLCNNAGAGCTTIYFPVWK